MHKHLQVSCIFICESAFYIHTTLLFWDHSEICLSRRRNMLRKITSEKKLSRNIRREKASFRKNPLIAISATTTYLMKTSGAKLSENIGNIKKHPNVPKRRKMPIIRSPFARLRISTNSLRWMFLIVFLYLTVSIIALLFQQGGESIRGIVVYSIMGFVTFFMGYFGWRIAQMLKETIISKKLKNGF